MSSFGRASFPGRPLFSRTSLERQLAGTFCLVTLSQRRVCPSGPHSPASVQHAPAATAPSWRDLVLCLLRVSPCSPLLPPRVLRIAPQTQNVLSKYPLTCISPLGFAGEGGGVPSLEFNSSTAKTIPDAPSGPDRDQPFCLPDSPPLETPGQAKGPENRVGIAPRFLEKAVDVRPAGPHTRPCSPATSGPVASESI